MGRATKGLTKALLEIFTRPAKKKIEGVEEEGEVEDPALLFLCDRVIALDDLRSAGAIFSYPEALSVVEWEGLIGLKQARAKLEREKAEADQAMAPSDAVSRQQRRDLIAKAGGSR